MASPSVLAAWAASTAYRRGNLVVAFGSVWMANADFTSGATFDPANWTLVSSGGFGFPHTVDPGQIRANDTLALSANQALYGRCRDGGTISAVALEVGTQSGNISVAAYRQSASGRAGVPSARLATSGAVACPAGYSEVSLGATVTLAPGDWLALSCDNGTATFRSNLITVAASSLGLGRQFVQSTAHPLPDPPASLTADIGKTIVLIGV